MALGSSISKEEKAAGVGLSGVLEPHLPSPGELIYPMQARYGWGRKERVSEPAERYEAQTGLSPYLELGRNHPDGGGTMGPHVASEPELGAQGMGVKHSQAQPPCPKPSL